MVITASLKGGAPWGFRIAGGLETQEPLTITKLNTGSKAYNAGLAVGDQISSINGHQCDDLLLSEAQQLIKQASHQLIIEVTRDGKKLNGDVKHQSSTSLNLKSREIPVVNLKSTDISDSGSPKSTSVIVHNIPVISGKTTSNMYQHRMDDSTSWALTSTLGRPKVFTGKSRVGPTENGMVEFSPTTKSKGMSLFLKQQEKLSNLAENSSGGSSVKYYDDRPQKAGYRMKPKHAGYFSEDEGNDLYDHDLNDYQFRNGDFTPKFRFNPPDTRKSVPVITVKGIKRSDNLEKDPFLTISPGSSRISDYPLIDTPAWKKPKSSSIGSNMVDDKGSGKNRSVIKEALLEKKNFLVDDEDNPEIELEKILATLEHRKPKVYKQMDEEKIPIEKVVPIQVSHHTDDISVRKLKTQDIPVEYSSKKPEFPNILYRSLSSPGQPLSPQKSLFSSTFSPSYSKEQQSETYKSKVYHVPIVKQVKDKDNVPSVRGISVKNKENRPMESASNLSTSLYSDDGQKKDLAVARNKYSPAAVWSPSGGNTSVKVKEFRPVQMKTTSSPQAPAVEKAKPPAEKPVPPSQQHDDYQVEGHSSSLPSTISPYVTLLQKSRDGEIPRGVQYLPKDESIMSRSLTDSTDVSNDRGHRHADDERSWSEEERSTKKKPADRYAPEPNVNIKEGIGPVDEDGVPLSFRKDIDEKNQRDWYKQMYRSLHKYGRKGSLDHIIDSYEPTYQFPGEQIKAHQNIDSSSPKDKRKQENSEKQNDVAQQKPLAKWNIPDARSDPQSYRIQPRSIIDYEPGFSSIAFNETKRDTAYNPPIPKPGQFSQYISGQKTLIDPRSLQVEADEKSYKDVQRGGSIPIRGFQKPVHDHYGYDERQKADYEEKQRKRREADYAYRKKRLDEIQSQTSDPCSLNTHVSHPDYARTFHKDPIPHNRFDTMDLYIPPERRRGFQIKGRARAMYNFLAQNPNELSFRKGEILYLHRQIDQNWFEGEKHGNIGIFPTSYVEIITSIDKAKAAALQAEGQGRVKFPFKAQTSVELDLKKGDTVVLLRRVDENWYEGQNGYRQGIFPCSYVEVIREPSTPLVTPAPSVITTPMIGTPDNLSPVAFDAPTPPPQPSPTSMQQRPSSTPIYNQGGFGSYTITDPSVNVYQFPSPARNYSGMNQYQHQQGYGQQRSRNVEYTGKPADIRFNSLDRAAPVKSKVADDDLALTRYRAMYPYRRQNEDELELLEGDDVYVMEQCDDGWYVGTSARTGEFGTFPGNYVQIVSR